MALAPSQLPSEVLRTLNQYLKDLETVFSDTLHSVVLYGSAARGEYLADRSNLNLLIVVTVVEPASLAAYAKVHRRWSKDGIIVPLFLTPQELSESAEVYPLEYSEMHEAHLLLAGTDPFANVPVDHSRVLLQCRQEIAGNLIRLRQRFVEGGGSPEAIALLLGLSITSLLPALRGLLRAGLRARARTTEAVFDQVQSELGLDVAPLREAWQIKRAISSPGPLELPRLFGRYTACLLRLAEKARAIEPSS